MSKLVGFLVAALGLLVVSQTPSLSASKDAAYCRAAGDWAEAEMTKHIEDSSRRTLDAVEDFGPTQREERSYFVFIVEAIYNEKIQPPIEGLDEMNKNIADLNRAFARHLAEDVCVKEFLG